MNDIKTKSITILGSTGSIGTQCLDIISSFSSVYRVNFLTTFSNISLLAQQCNVFSPKGVVIVDFDAYKRFLNVSNFKGKVLYGAEGLLEAASDEGSGVVVSALVGISGLKPTIGAIKSKKTILLANKESLVVAGNYLMSLAKANGIEIIPIDSEHSAIFQCLQGEKLGNISRIILTASGGPFFNIPVEDLFRVKASDALKHPT